MSDDPLIRSATPADLDALEAIEERCFINDRISRRSFKRWLHSPHGLFFVAEVEGRPVGYALTILHRGTSLARLYSLAVLPELRRRGIGTRLMDATEHAASGEDKLFLRLEVATDNHPARTLYEHRAFKPFGLYHDYYGDHRDAVRMQKKIRYVPENLRQHPMPWYRQTTKFTCGPSALMMAMGRLDAAYRPSQEEELAIWRESTTIFMTAGHGGCHPVGLALSAARRGFVAETVVNRRGALFVDSVRGEEKKHILRLVDGEFRREADEAGVPVIHREVRQKDIDAWFAQGRMVLMLISVYRLEGKKAPHWVVVSGTDDAFLYAHDPDPVEGMQQPVDCQYIPIPRGDFDRMFRFGASRLRAAIVIGPRR